MNALHLLNVYFNIFKNEALRFCNAIRWDAMHACDEGVETLRRIMLWLDCWGVTNLDHYFSYDRWCVTKSHRYRYPSTLLISYHPKNTSLTNLSLYFSSKVIQSVLIFLTDSDATLIEFFFFFLILKTTWQYQTLCTLSRVKKHPKESMIYDLAFHLRSFYFADRRLPI